MIWDRLGGVAGLIPPEPQEVARLSRRMVLASSLAVVAISPLLLSAPAWASILSTPVARRRRLMTPAGPLLIDCDTVLLRLNTQDRVSYKCVRGQGYAKLTHGSLHFEEDRYGIRLAPGAFNISKSEGLFSLAVIEGSAMLRPHGHARGVTMHAGQRVFLTRNHSPRTDRPNMRDILAWLRNRVVIHNQPLAAIIAQMNRYDRVQIVLESAHFARHRMSGSYPIGSNKTFARAITAMVPLQATGINPIRLSDL